MPRLEMGDASLGQHLQYGVYPDDSFVTKPQNWDELLDMNEQPRLVLIPSKLRMRNPEYCGRYQRRLKTNTTLWKIFSPSLQDPPSFTPPGIILFKIWTNLLKAILPKFNWTFTIDQMLATGVDASNLNPKLLTKQLSFLKPLEDKKIPVVPIFFWCV